MWERFDKFSSQFIEFRISLHNLHGTAIQGLNGAVPDDVSSNAWSISANNNVIINSDMSCPQSLALIGSLLGVILQCDGWRPSDVQGCIAQARIVSLMPLPVEWNHNVAIGGRSGGGFAPIFTRKRGVTVCSCLRVRRLHPFSATRLRCGKTDVVVRGLEAGGVVSVGTEYIFVGMQVLGVVDKEVGHILTIALVAIRQSVETRRRPLFNVYRHTEAAELANECLQFTADTGLIPDDLAMRLVRA